MSDLATPWTAAYQAPPSMGFSRQEYWSGVPLPSPSCGANISKLEWVHLFCCYCCSVVKSCPILCDSMNYMQNTRLPCPSLSFWVCSSSCMVWQRCHSTIISPSVTPFSSWPQSFPPIRVFSNESALASGGQSIGASASASVLPITIQGWFPLWLTGLISLLSKGSSKFFSSTTVWRHQFFGTQPSLCPNSHIGTWLLEKPQLWLYGPLSAKWYLCFLICCSVLSSLFFQEASIF